MTTHTFMVNGEQVSVDSEDDVRLLWVLRDILNIRGPKYGCGLGVCQACTSHINGDAFNPCSVRVGDLHPDDHIVTIEGLAGTVAGDLHPVQQAWLDFDVAQCGYCQPGQIMASVALINRVIHEQRDVTDADLDGLRNVCRCGTYPRIRAAIVEAAARVRAMSESETLAELQPGGPAGSGGDGLPSTGGASVVGAANAPSGDGLSAAERTSGLGAASLAAGAAVAIRSLTRRASPDPSAGREPTD